VTDAAAGAGPPAALDSPPTLTPVLDLAVDCDAPVDVGPVPGGFRRIIPITGGWFAGLGDREISGEVLPGGADWNLQRADGVFDVWARYLLRTDDGALLTITNTGLISFGGGEVRSRTVAQFEVAAEPHRWLTRSILVGHLVARNPFTGVDIRLHRVD
jgi:Protein of unknown function (DUF3237)